MIWRKNWLVWSWERKAEKIPVKKWNSTKERRKFWKERRNFQLLVKEEEGMKCNGGNEKEKKWKMKGKSKKLWMIKKSNKTLNRYYSQEKQIKENRNERSKKEKKEIKK